MMFRRMMSRLNLEGSRRYPKVSSFFSILLGPVARKIDVIFRQRKLNEVKELEQNSSMVKGARIASIYQLPDSSLSSSFRPLVSVIVPNYNHAPYLRQRLDSIYRQSYSNIEVILLDDCSTDDSQAILREYFQKYQDKTKLLLNRRNSGGVFFQWKKGFDAAKGDLVWIAESDDWCELNFLEELVPFFQDEAVCLAYCRTDFMKGHPAERIWTIEEYVSDIDSHLWISPFMRAAPKIVREAFAYKNIIPNVSSVLFRNLKGLALLDDQDWQKMRVCGDWLLYAEVIKGGVLAYTPKTTNYYRIHENNTSVNAYSKDSYYQEHERVASFVSENYRLNSQPFVKQQKNLEEHWLRTRSKDDVAQLSECWSLERILAAGRKRRPNILMAGYAFSAGGGETFPIQLANRLKDAGYAITFLDCGQEPREEGVRDMLRSDIPVVTNFYALEQIVRDFDIDIIHSHHAWVDNTILDLLPENAPCKTVISLHGMYEMMDDHALRRLLPRLLARTGKFVFTADKNLEAFHRMGIDTNTPQFIKIGNALDIVPIHPVDRSKIGIPASAFVLCLVSRAIPEKGWREAVEAVKLAREMCGRDIHLILIGEGAEYDSMLSEGPPEYVHLLGFKKNIRDYFAASDMGFIPSRFKGESFPLVLIDCFHAGKPVLASSIGEIPAMMEANGELAGALFSLQDWQIPVREVAKMIVRCASDAEYYKHMLSLVSAAAEKFDPV
ncbi:glycosyltransferase, partial [Candidatus Parcubacteria bacterium]